jgi:hypothetical protein
VKVLNDEYVRLKALGATPKEVFAVLDQRGFPGIEIAIALRKYFGLSLMESKAILIELDNERTGTIFDARIKSLLLEIETQCGETD